MDSLQINDTAKDALDEELGSEMTLFEHLSELRKRLIYSIFGVFVGFGVSWIWVKEIYEFLSLPLKKATSDPGMAQLHYKDLTEPFFTLLKTAIVAGIFLAIPVILWQVWKFIAPGLYAHEKRFAIPFVILATGFFLGGAAFCYYLVMPFGFEFLFEFGSKVADANPSLMMSEHYGLAIKLLLAFGAVFEMPVIAMFLSVMGVITHRTLIAYWRVAIVGSFIFAAVLTPPDVITQVAMAVPLVILYSISIVVAYVFTSRRERRASKEISNFDMA